MDRDFGATISIRRIIRRGYRDNSRFFKTNLTRAPAGLGVSLRWLDCGLNEAFFCPVLPAIMTKQSDTGEKVR